MTYAEACDRGYDGPSPAQERAWRNRCGGPGGCRCSDDCPGCYDEEGQEDFEVLRFSGVAFSRKTGKARLRLTSVTINGDERTVRKYGRHGHYYLTPDLARRYAGHLNLYIASHPITGPKMAACIEAL